jgi:hypothetical protein
MLSRTVFKWEFERTGAFTRFKEPRSKSRR